MTSRRRRFNSNSPWKGVYFDRVKNAYRAYQTVKGKREHLGYYSSEIEAARAVDNATRETYGAEGKYNLPLMGESSAI